MIRYRHVILSILFLFLTSLSVSVPASGIDKPSLPLFKWSNQQQFSVQLGKSFSQNTDQTVKSFFNDSLLYVNWHRNLIQFPYVLKWGIKSHLGWNFNKEDNEERLINISVSSIAALQIIDPQFIVPFIEIGASTWNIDFDYFSDISFFWGAGILLSMATFKPSLSYSLPDEYNIHDIGFLLQFVQQYDEPVEEQNNMEDSICYFHLGLYLTF